MNIFIDLLLLGLAHLFFPTQKAPQQRKRWDESSASWIILDSPQDYNHNNNVVPPNNRETDPFLNGDYDNGPDW